MGVLSEQFETRFPTPVDNKQGPFASVAAANAAITLAYRYKGLTVIIDDGVNPAQEYWYASGVLDGNLTQKSISGGANRVAHFNGSGVLTSTSGFSFDSNGLVVNVSSGGYAGTFINPTGPAISAASFGNNTVSPIYALATSTVLTSRALVGYYNAATSGGNPSANFGTRQQYDASYLNTGTGLPTQGTLGVLDFYYDNAVGVTNPLAIARIGVAQSGGAYAYPALFRFTGLQYIDGSVSLPSISNQTDTDTGLYWSRDTNIKRLSVAIGGTEELRIFRNTVTGAAGISINDATDPSGALRVRGNDDTTGMILNLVNASGTSRHSWAGDGTQVIGGNFTFPVTGGNSGITHTTRTPTVANITDTGQKTFTDTLINLPTFTVTGGTAFAIGIDIVGNASMLVGLRVSGTSGTRAGVSVSGTGIGFSSSSTGGAYQANPASGFCFGNTSNGAISRAVIFNQFFYNNAALTGVHDAYISRPLNNTTIMTNGASTRWTLLSADGLSASAGNTYFELGIVDNVTATYTTYYAVQTTVNGVSAERFRIAGRNFGFNTTSFGASSNGVLSIGNRTAAPTGNPTDASLLYSASNRLKTYYGGERDVVVSDATTGAAAAAAGTIRVNINGVNYNLLHT